MRQQLITYLSTIQDELITLNKYLFENSEESFSEKKSCEYISRLLKEHNFEIENNFKDMSTAFYAQYGTGHPKVCFICKYTGYPEGHIYGNNISATMAIGAALSLSRVITQLGGSVVLIGCPGDHLKGGELSLVKEGVFEDIDAILCPYAYTNTITSGTSKAMIPVKISFSCDYNKDALNHSLNPALDACLLTFNTLSIIIKSSCSNCIIDDINIEAIHCLNDGKQKAEANFNIKSCVMKDSEDLENKLRNFVNSTSSIVDVEGKVSLKDIPSEHLISNPTLSRIFTSNLKENGIINVEGSRDFPHGLSIGSISHIAPCIYPAIGVIENNNIKYPSIDFGNLTLEEFAIDKMFSAIKALAITGIDIIESSELLKEMTEELHSNTNFQNK